MISTKFLRLGTKTLAALLFVVYCFSGHAQKADQAWLKYRPTGKPLNLPTNVRVLGQGLVEETAAAELRRGLVSRSGGSPLESGPNMILVGTAQEMQSHESDQR